MKVLNISTDDYANFAHDNANALRSVGVECKDVKLNAHVFKYKNESRIIHSSNIDAYVKEADVVQIFHSDSRILNSIVKHKKRIIVYHTGSRYRANPELYNELFNPYVERSVIALCEFEGLGSKNETYLCGAIDFQSSRTKPTGRRKIIAHYPSNAEVKGTDTINKLIVACERRFIYKHSEQLVSHSSQKRRMEECDIYIELLKPSIDGKEYGSWGITALEAASMGKVVVTQNLHNDVYERVYGRCPLILVKDEMDFVAKINELTALSAQRLNEIKDETKAWFIKNHTYKATGNRIKELL